MDVGPPVIADAQSAELILPGERALHHPSPSADEHIALNLKDPQDLADPRDRPIAGSWRDVPGKIDVTPDGLIVDVHLEARASLLERVIEG